MTNTTIQSIRGRQILDSRGRPTVEVDIGLGDGSFGRASVPSGASTGAAEAHELRDGDKSHYQGLGVRKAVANVNNTISRALVGFDVMDQAGLDARLLDLDGTEQLRNLGANAVLGTSLAACRAAAASANQALYQRIAELSGTRQLTMPMPMVNILSGGLHARHGMDVQDFLAMPASATSMEHAIELVCRIRFAAAQVMDKRGVSTLLADEGGLSPGCRTGREALQLMVEATECAGLVPGEDMLIAIDVASSSLRGPNGTYRLVREDRNATREEMIDMMKAWVSEFPIASIEDGLDEEDWDGWKTLTNVMGDHVRLVGDDLFTTNLKRVNYGIENGIANGVLVKVNQNGTLSGTLSVIAAAKAAGYAPIISARSGETEDNYIADLAVGTAAGQIKIGSTRTSDRLSKYNQLLRIEEHCAAPYAGTSTLLGRFQSGG